MKKSLFLIVVIAILGLNCRKAEGEFLFEMSFPNQDIFIPAGLNTIESYFFPINQIETNIDFFLNNNNVAIEEITAINPRFARITALNGNIDFDFVEEISIRICDTDEPNCALEIFYLNNIPFGTTDQIDLLPSLANTKRFLEKEDFKIEVVLLRLRDISPFTIDARVDFSFEARK